MSSDATFRVLLIVGYAILLPIALVYRIKSQSTGESLDRRREGLIILLTLRPAAGLAALGMIAYLVNPASMAWSALPLPDWARWIGVTVWVAAGALWIWAFAALGPNLTDTVVTRRDHALITHGPYRFVRHPFYDAVALHLFACALVAANGFLLVTGTIVITLIVLRTRREEAELLARFGVSYRAYVSRTGRFLPRLGPD